MKKALFIFIFLFVTIGVTNAQYFSISGGAGIALNLQSNSTQSTFGFNFVHVEGQYTFNHLIATRLNFQFYDFPGRSFDSYFGTQGDTRSFDAGGVIDIKGDFMIGNFERNASMVFYGYVGPGLDIYTQTGSGGPYFHIDFGGGLNFKIAHNLYLTSETGFAITTSTPVGLTIPFKFGVKYDFE